MTPRVYIAAPWLRWREAERFRNALAAHHLECTSSWIDDARTCDGPESLASLEPDVVQAVAARNDADVDDAHIVVALTWPGEGGEMFAEVARALLHGRPVVWVGERRTLSAYRPGVVLAADMFEAIDAALTAARGARRCA